VPYATGMMNANCFRIGGAFEASNAAINRLLNFNPLGGVVTSWNRGNNEDPQHTVSFGSVAPWGDRYYGFVAGVYVPTFP